eukprot:5882986-Pyramimonas_sp.AAC.1
MQDGANTCWSGADHLVEIPASVQHQRAGDEEHRIARVQPVPNSAYGLCHDQRLQTRFLAFGCHPIVNVMPQPVPGTYVPVQGVLHRAFGELHAMRAHV